MQEHKCDDMRREQALCFVRIVYISVTGTVRNLAHTKQILVYF